MSFRSRITNNLLLRVCFLPHRHPRLPYDHSDRHLSGIPLRRIRRVHFLHPRRLQRRSQSFPRPLICKRGYGQQVWECRQKKRGILCCFILYLLAVKRKGRVGASLSDQLLCWLMDPKQINASRC